MTQPLLQTVLTGLHQTAFKRFTTGLLLPLRSAKFLIGNRGLFRFVIIPALINLALFILMAALLIWQAGGVVEWIWSRPDVGEAWTNYLLIIVWYVFFALVIGLAFVISYLAVLIFGGIVASPFNDKLSAHTEAVLLQRPLAEDSTSALITIMTSIASSAMVALIYLAVMFPVVLLNLVPAIGSVVASVLGLGVSAFFIALEYSDSALDRRKYQLSNKLALLRANLPMAAGFGLGTTIMLWVPFVNFLCMPIAVIGGTALAIGLDEDSPHNS